MIRSNQIVAGLTILAIMATTIIFAYGQSVSTLGELFSFSLLNLAAKVALSVAMFVIVLFSRPRSLVSRVAIGLAAVVVLGYATFGALSSTLPLGDAVIYFAGTLIAMLETVEATLPRRKYKTDDSLLGSVSEV